MMLCELKVNKIVQVGDIINFKTINGKLGMVIGCGIIMGTEHIAYGRNYGFYDKFKVKILSSITHVEQENKYIAVFPDEVVEVIS